VPNVLKYGSLKLSETSGPLQVSNGVALYRRDNPTDGLIDLAISKLTYSKLTTVFQTHTEIKRMSDCL